jgi:hypothetical protein
MLNLSLKQVRQPQIRPTGFSTAIGASRAQSLDGGKIVERAVVRLRVAKIWASSGAGVSLEDGFWSMKSFCFMVAHTRNFFQLLVQYGGTLNGWLH